MSELLTIGYTEPGAQERIDAFLGQSERHILCDIRFRPYSRWRPAFNHGALRERHGEQYALFLDLGNVNYQDPHGDIVLNNPDTGVRDILNLLESGRSVMLMCACKDYERCHRKVVYELVRGALLGSGKMQCHCCDQFVSAECGEWTEPGENGKRYWLCFDCIK